MGYVLTGYVYTANYQHFKEYVIKVEAREELSITIDPRLSQMWYQYLITY